LLRRFHGTLYLNILSGSGLEGERELNRILSLNSSRVQKIPLKGLEHLIFFGLPFMVGNRR
jgi:hypothetical protein